MASFNYKYKCDKTGQTYPLEMPRSSAGADNDENTLKLEARCPQCGGNHIVFMEENKSKAAAES